MAENIHEAMPEEVNDITIFSLLEVTKRIQKAIKETFQDSFWVKAEMNKLNLYRQSGHCYPELVEKQDGKVIAQIKSHLWQDDYLRINRNFQDVLKEPLKDGIKILLRAKVSFDSVYGLSLWITDIDPSYTLGDLEKEKQRTIQQLKEEGIFTKNKLLKLPLLPQRVAIISVETSKGYADFLDVLETNGWNYKFFHVLFPSLLQGDKAVQSILAQLKRIRKVIRHFDVVVIIRGGGGDVGLSCYNNFDLAKEVAMFPIPVLTGIGHSTNETVTEMISFSNAITPTKLAEYLLQKFHNFSVPVQDSEKKIIDKSRRLLGEEKTKFRSELKLFRSVTENILITHHNEIRVLSQSLIRQALFIFKKEKEGLHQIKINIIRESNDIYSTAHHEIKYFANAIGKDVRSQLIQFMRIVSQLKEKLLVQSSLKFKNTKLDLNNIEKNINNMSPRNVLKRGYSITQLNGKSLTRLSQVISGDTLNTIVFEGNIISTVKSTKKTKEQ